MTGREVLHLLTRLLPGSGWTIANGNLYFGDELALAYAPERRFYRVEPIIEALDEAGEGEAFGALMTAVRDHLLGQSRIFDRQWTSIEEWRGLLTVSVSEQDQRRIHRFLDRVFVRQMVPSPCDEPWCSRIAEVMRTPLRFEFGATESAYQAIQSIGEAVGVMVDSNERDELEGLSPEEWRRAVQGNLVHQEFVPMESLAEMASLVDLRLDVVSGAVNLTRQPTTELHFYSPNGLAESVGAGYDDLANEVVDFLHWDIAPYSWDEDPRLSARRFGDLLLVNQFPHVHPEIAMLLDQMQRAARGD